MSLALWLRAGRAQRGLSLDDVARVTKIQPRILERLEAGALDGLPAEVFVRGFVRSFARCVGLDEDEALRRYAACGAAAGPTRGPRSSRPGSLDRPHGDGAAATAPTARALVEAMADLVPGSARSARATSPRMLTVDVVDLAAGSLRDLPAGGAIVETMLLPETGTVVVAPAVPPPMPVAVVAPSIPVAVVAPDPSPALSAVPDADPSLVTDAAAALVAVAAAEPLASVAAVEPLATVPTGRKRTRRGKGRGKRGAVREDAGAPATLAAGTPASASPVVVPADPVTPGPAIPEPGVAIELVTVELAAEVVTAVDASAPAAVIASDEPELAAARAGAVVDEVPIEAPWAPKMPPIAAAPSVPWRRPAYAGVTATALVPTLVIDDADPDSAERVLEERAEKHPARRSFLPPILLDREDRSARQGGLTLAVIILLIAATLTLSYLMRRPSASGDGMTRRELPAASPGMLA